MKTPQLATALLGALLLTHPLAAQAGSGHDYGGLQLSGNLAVHGDVVHTMDGAPIQDGLVLIRDGKIAYVGPAADRMYTADMVVLRGAVVTPGLVDAHGTLGLTGITNQPGDQDQLDRSEPAQPELRALDAYNARDPLVAWVRSHGTTTVHTGHAPGALISGQTMIVKLRGDTVDEAVLVPAAMVAATLGDGGRNPAEGKAPGTRAKSVAMLRGELIAASDYAAKREAEPGTARDLRKETLARVLSGELPLLVTAHRHQDILGAIRVAQEFGIQLVLDGAADVPSVLDEVRAAGVPVLVHPPMMRTGSAAGEQANASFETPAILDREGIPFALQTGFEGYVPKVRVLLFEAAIAARYGLPFRDTLESVTLGPARILGIDDRVGSLEVGKDGDLAIFDGDPFEYRTHCLSVVIDGKLLSNEAR